MTKLYLISPPDFELEEFDKKLREVLEKCEVSVFQLRLKGKADDEVRAYAKKLLTICKQFNCMFILNDYVDIALEVGASGVHVGSDDEDIAKIRTKVGEDFVIGASCYDSRDLALEAELGGASYISFGAFFPTKTKVVRSRPDPSIIGWAKEILSLPVTAIGGVNSDNCGVLMRAGADFVCVISYVWDHPEGPCAGTKEIIDGLK